MITITQSGDILTLISVFTCEPENQQALIDACIRATEESTGKLPGIISAALHKSKDGTRVVNYSQWKSSEGWQKLVGSSYFDEMRKFGTPDPHLYEVCYLLDKTPDR